MVAAVPETTAIAVPIVAVHPGIAAAVHAVDSVAVALGAEEDAAEEGVVD